MDIWNVFVLLYKRSIYLTNERQTCKVVLFNTNKGFKGLEKL